jgi:hypothetical protein
MPTRNRLVLRDPGHGPFLRVQVPFVVIGHPELQRNPLSGPSTHGTGAWYLGPGHSLNSSRL